MKKAAVLYRSKYGATRKYALWLGEALGCQAQELGRTLPELGDCDRVVYAGGIYAGGVPGLSLLRENREKLAGKRLVVLCVGASPYDGKALKALGERSLGGMEVPLFYARGAWDESRMDWKDRTLCRLLQKAVARKSPAECEPWMAALLESAGQARDWTDRAWLEPLLAYLEA